MIIYDSKCDRCPERRAPANSVNLSLIIGDETRSYGHDFDFLPGHVIYSAKSIECRRIPASFIFMPLFVAIKARLTPRTASDNAVFSLQFQSQSRYRFWFRFPMLIRWLGSWLSAASISPVYCAGPGYFCSRSQLSLIVVVEASLEERKSNSFFEFSFMTFR